MKLQKKESFAINKELFITTSTDNILNHYDFHPKQLGRGAYGVVYKARQKNTEGPWRAVKKIPKKMIKQPELLANEIKILKTLDHPSIIRLYQCYEDQKNLFLVTDLCQGGELFDRLQQQGNFSQAQAKILFKQMLEGINYCHHQKIAHRDLKPQNFLFLNKNDMNLKIIDFGLSYPWAESMKKQIQQKGQKKLIGTSYYIAPQIIQGSYDQRCDIWSLGVILYILVTAVPPFDGQGDKQIIANVRKHNYTLNVPEMKDVSQSCKDLIKRILVPEDKRMTIDQIFKHPWMVQQASSKPLKINFNKVQNFSKFSKLKKLAATYIASKMSEKQVQELGKLFKQMDLNHDGQISIQQLKVALSDQKNKSSLQELKQIMESIDTDKNGKLNYTEFLAFAMQKEKLFKQENVKSAFRMLDKDGNGFVEKSQLLQVFAQNGLNQVNGKSIDELIKSCDKDGNGIIDYNEFKAAMM